MRERAMPRRPRLEASPPRPAEAGGGAGGGGGIGGGGGGGPRSSKPALCCLSWPSSDDMATVRHGVLRYQQHAVPVPLAVPDCCRWHWYCPCSSGTLLDLLESVVAM
ncbi:unnamed protein product [Prorocentrum cordatum]|uniref:Uncharacterized protein n=1 Tax=Prorocentrum cordatum TaxID=2364126 RepID=A0ABN9Y6X8_9DINO|nr:unnamed protein product [Polarella glacialis]